MVIATQKGAVRALDRPKKIRPQPAVVLLRVMKMLFIIPFILIPQGWVALILYFSGSSFIKEKRLLNRELKHREAARRPFALII